jgi:stage II sporulation protein P
MHDKESYRESYSRSSESIQKYLEEYPSIKYVFDLHRDSLMRSTGELISAVTSINGSDCAQIMPVVGSGYSGWESNMTFALKLREKLNGEFINMCRPACLRASTYNQNMAAVSVLLEIGTSGNTLSEAKNAAILTAKAIADIIKG